MRRHGIGGALDYTRLANLHRPTDPAALAREVRRLANTGLTPRDVAVMLGLAPSVVADMLDPPPPARDPAP